MRRAAALLTALLTACSTARPPVHAPIEYAPILSCPAQEPVIVRQSLGHWPEAPSLDELLLPGIVTMHPYNLMRLITGARRDHVAQ